VEALRKEFAQDLAHHKVEHITVGFDVAIVAVVGENMRGTPGSPENIQRPGPRKRESDRHCPGIFRNATFPSSSKSKP